VGDYARELEKERRALRETFEAARREGAEKEPAFLRLARTWEGALGDRVEARLAAQATLTTALQNVQKGMDALRAGQEDLGAKELVSKLVGQAGELAKAVWDLAKAFAR